MDKLFFGKPTLRAYGADAWAGWRKGETSPLDQKSSTGWLADLYGGTQSGDDWARVNIPVFEMRLQEFYYAHWSYYMTNTETMGVGMVIWMHDPADFDKRAEITQLGGVSGLAKSSGWNSHILSFSTTQFFFYGENTTGTTLTAGTTYTLDQFKADPLFSRWTVYRITLEYGWEASGTFEDAYIADIKLNDTMIQLKPSVGDNIGSEVKTIYKATATDSSTVATAITPTTGKKVRIISVQACSSSATAANIEVYFGTGANITTTVTKAIFLANLDTDVRPYEGMCWPAGCQPVGAVDDVVSVRTSVNITSNGLFVITYKEE